MAGSERRRRSGRGFHELPLVFFTALATAGAGLGAAQLVLAGLGWAPWVPQDDRLSWAGGCLALGLLFSLGHLGRPLRGPLALAGIVRSPLSNEVVVVVGTLAALLLFRSLPAGHVLAAPVSLAAQVGCLLTLVALGLVYRLPGQLTWQGSAVIHPLILGVGLGAAYHLPSLPDSVRARGELVVLLVLCLDGLAIWERARRSGTAPTGGLPVHPGFSAHKASLFSARILLGVLVPAAALLGGRPDLTLWSLAANLVLDRFLFYGLAFRATVESEVARVEAALANRNGSPSV